MASDDANGRMDDLQQASEQTNNDNKQQDNLNIFQISNIYISIELSVNASIV